MLSAQCDELRAMAESVGMEMPQAATLMMEAADIIDCLDTENAKLRELVRWMYDRMDESCAVQYPYAPAPINYDRLMQARARARELGVEVDG